MTARPTPSRFFQQSLKSEARHADELINIYLLRPLAAVVVWLVYPTRVTPNQITVLAAVVGCAAGGVYLMNTPLMIALGGLLVTVKDILDDADGQLARAKQLYSRRGRFLDSIADAVVDLAVFTAITIVVYQTTLSGWTILLGLLSFIGITLRVSYHVYYQVSYLHLENRSKLNRIVENITEEDRKDDVVALRLQKIFNVIYTWQDKLMARIDRWCKGEPAADVDPHLWYGDRVGLGISGLLGFGTEFMVLTVCSLWNELHLYLWLNALVMNAIFLVSVLYRRYILRRSVADHSHFSSSGS